WEMENQNCKTCNTALNGPFCYNCGQKYINTRLTVKIIFRQLFSMITNLEHGMWYTLIAMFRHPAKVINDYISGATIKYYNPIRLVLVIGTLSILIMLTFTSFTESQAEIQEMINPNMTENQAAFQEAFGKRIEPFMNLMPILLIPFFSIASYLLYRKKHLNYAEHMVMHAFSYAALSLITIPTLFLYDFFDIMRFSPIVGIFVFALFLAYVYRKLFKSNWFVSLLKGVLSMVLGYSFFFLTFMILVLIIMPILIFTGILDPAMFQ
ncbi:MAG: DUF3667 domain-containing protein, partial [Bacteroidota bacterium]